jgi:hypothetical protein
MYDVSVLMNHSTKGWGESPFSFIMKFVIEAKSAHHYPTGREAI